MKYGLQMYSIRDVAEKDFEQGLKLVAEMGYDMIECDGFGGFAPEEAKAMIAHYGLTVCSNHLSHRDVFNDFEKTLEYHKKVGCHDLIIASTIFSTKEEIDYSVACFNRYQPLIEAEGLRLHYHNHSKEFLPNKDGLIAQDEFAKRTKVGFELDTFWVYNAGLDPLAVMEQYRDRVRFIHLKDGVPKDPTVAGSHTRGTSLGQGTAPVEAVRQKAYDMGLCVVVESEGLDPTGPEEVKRCIDYLRALDAKDGK